MKAAVLSTADSQPQYADFAEPAEAEGREIVELVTAGIHQVVRTLATAKHYGSTGIYPLVPGIDAVARTADGTLIYTGGVQAPFGTFAERMSVPTAMMFPLPPGARPELVAGGINPGMSSWLPLKARLDEVDKLGTVVVVGATGMAGLIAVQNARELGADRVVALGRDSGRLERATSFGATTVALQGDRDSYAAAIAGVLDGTTPSLVLDYVWGAPAEAVFASLSRRGLDEDKGDISYVQIGALAGVEAAVPAALLRSRRIRVLGSGAGTLSQAQIKAQLPVYMQLIAEGRVDVPVRAIPLRDIAEAWGPSTESGVRTVVTAD